MATSAQQSSPATVILMLGMKHLQNELSSLVHSILKHMVLIISGDMFAQIGKNEDNEFCLHNSSNRNGEHLTEISLENRLTCLNTKFQKREGKLWTYIDANNARAQIDYIFMNKKWINCTLNCEARFPIEEVSSDHRIVTTKIHLSLHRNMTQTVKPTHHNWSSLDNVKR